MKKNVYIIDDYHFLAKGLVSLLRESFPDIDFNIILCSMSNIYERIQVPDGSLDEAIIIMDIRSRTESMLDGLSMLTTLKQCSKHIHIIVLTELVNPLVFRAIDNRKPSMIISQKEPCDIISQLIGIALSGFYHSNTMTIYSPIAASILAFSRQIKITSKALDVLVCQHDGLTLKETAKLMNLPYKSVSYLKCKVSKNFLL
ncbi:DNA-binding NarL/FixJ family response regulator [Grimontella sp. AG753]|nr:DNA-binding NarL/FixJ family response regulator [Grimontella sp. AG753]